MARYVQLYRLEDGDQALITRTCRVPTAVRSGPHATVSQELRCVTCERRAVTPR